MTEWYVNNTEVREAFAKGKLYRLGKIQRNLLLYYINHKRKSPGTPCYVPRPACHHLASYLNAIDVLEERGLVSVIREGDDCQQWIFTEPQEDEA